MAAEKTLAPSRLALLALGLSAALILWIGNATNLDLRLADALYDKSLGAFPLQHAWFAEKLNHEVLKALMAVLAAGVIVLCLYDLYRPLSIAPVHRLGLRVVAMSAVAVPVVISLLKRASSSHCPWDLARYGGNAPYIRLLEWMPDGVAAGHCLPGGHASSALWLVSLAAFWVPHRPRMAFAVASIMLGFGAGVGAVQQLRGAHFLTHTLWSMWLACAIIFLIYQINAKALAKIELLGYSSVPRNAAH